jgi:hypothetical protein
MSQSFVFKRSGLNAYMKAHKGERKKDETIGEYRHRMKLANDEFRANGGVLPSELKEAKDEPKKRGRPKKVKEESKKVEEVKVETKKIGRPRKVKEVKEEVVKLEEVKEAPKKRGRSKKVKEELKKVEEVKEAPKKRGRPKGSKNKEDLKMKILLLKSDLADAYRFGEEEEVERLLDQLDISLDQMDMVGQ